MSTFSARVIVRATRREKARTMPRAESQPRFAPKRRGQRELPLIDGDTKKRWGRSPASAIWLANQIWLREKCACDSNLPNATIQSIQIAVPPLFIRVPMALSKAKCPECDLIFDVPASAAGSIACPVCETACEITPPSQPKSDASDAKVPISKSPVPITLKAPPPAPAERVPSTPKQREGDKAPVRRSNRRMVLVAAAVVAGLILLPAGAALCAYLLSPEKPAATEVAAATTAPEPAPVRQAA